MRQRGGEDNNAPFPISTVWNVFIIFFRTLQEFVDPLKPTPRNMKLFKYIFLTVSCLIIFVTLKAHSDSAKVKEKSKTVFDVWHIFLDLFCLLYDLFRFRSRFRLVWMGPLNCFKVGGLSIQVLSALFQRINVSTSMVNLSFVKLGQENVGSRRWLRTTSYFKLGYYLNNRL